MTHIICDCRQYFTIGVSMLIRILLACFCSMGLVAMAQNSSNTAAIQSSALTDTQRAQLIQEVRAVTSAMGEASQRLDIDAAMKDWLDSPVSLVVGSDGQIADPKVLRESVRSFYESLASLRFTTIREEFRVLAPDLVLQAWCYKVEGTGKKGSQFVIDTETASLLFRKVDGAWKIVFFQESASPLRRVPAETGK